MKLGKYRHYKGNVYNVIGVAKHSETLEDLIIYVDDNDNSKMWARPESMWNDEIIIDSKKVRRFTLIEEK